LRCACRYYGEGTQLGYLVNLFFITFVIFSFPSSWFIERFGLRAGVVLGAWFQAIGTALRCLGGSAFPQFELRAVVIGQAVASLGQAFFVNPPPQLAAAWFGTPLRRCLSPSAVARSATRALASDIHRYLARSQPILCLCR
jgi:MFS family permease